MAIYHFLKPHFLFLNSRGYETTGTTNGQDALDLIEAIEFDIILLDENMPGLSGIETLQSIKTKKPQLPVIMITKNEEEKIMEEAIGEKISDYLIKPVNPNQILLSLKKILRHKDLIAEKTIEKSIKSVLQQTLKPKEIIVINDCSTDKTLKLIKNFNQIKIINNKKRIRTR